VPVSGCSGLGSSGTELLIQFAENGGKAVANPNLGGRKKRQTTMKPSKKNPINALV